MKLEEILQQRAGQACELCGANEKLIMYKVPPQDHSYADIMMNIESVLSGEIWLQATSRKLQALIDACFRPSAINGINEAGII